uniref:Uncharacterized protein n=1 Tax=Arundo donax TaxID=35708 RepID=A0A0A9HHG9_ARUDO
MLCFKDCISVQNDNVFEDMYLDTGVEQIAQGNTRRSKLTYLLVLVTWRNDSLPLLYLSLQPRAFWQSSCSRT